MITAELAELAEILLGHPERQSRDAVKLFLG
jgi:hypothetical protein